MLVGLAMPAGAVTIPQGGAAPGTAIGLGTNFLDFISIPNTTPVTVDYFFHPLVSGTLSINSVAATSSGANALSPFSIQIINLTTATILGTDNTPVSIGNNEGVGLSGLAFIFGNNYELIISATAASNNTFPVGISGNVTVNPVPLPPAIGLFATALVGLGLLGRRRRTQSAV